MKSGSLRSKLKQKLKRKLKQKRLGNTRCSKIFKSIFVLILSQRRPKKKRKEERI
jgi:hypothetical protein